MTQDNINKLNLALQELMINADSGVAFFSKHQGLLMVPDVENDEALMLKSGFSVVKSPQIVKSLALNMKAPINTTFVR